MHLRANLMNITAVATAASALLLNALPAHADDWLGADRGKLLLTAGFSDADGAGGGGLVPLALITGYGSNRSWGANAHYTAVLLQDFQLHAYGVAVGAFDRIELSYTQQQLDVTGTALNGISIHQDIYGMKVKLIGNAVYAQDSWLPQVAAGVQYKRNLGISHAATAGLPGLVSPTQLGARDDNGVDYYLSGTKIFLAQSVVVNASVRYTKANQLGLLGFGGDRDSGYSVQPEGTLAYLLTRELALGAEYRGRPHNLGVDQESAAWDLFAGWTPTKNISLVAAYLNMGSILAPVTAKVQHQRGAYLSVQVGF
jgi:Protein of unknown function (DUF3034)